MLYIFSCRLYIGLGVGIPLLIIIIISVILLYVCWTCYHRKQMRYLTRIYIEQRAAAAELHEQDSEQPPGYNTEDQHKIDSRHGLPSYSENDPYPDSSQPPPQYATEGSTVEVQPDVIRREEDNISEQDRSSISDETTNDVQPLINWTCYRPNLISTLYTSCHLHFLLFLFFYWFSGMLSCIIELFKITCHCIIFNIVILCVFIFYKLQRFRSQKCRTRLISQ